MIRWAKSGMLNCGFENLRTEQIERIMIEAFPLDSTSAKVHSDGTARQSMDHTAAALLPRDYDDDSLLSNSI